MALRKMEIIWHDDTIIPVSSHAIALIYKACGDLAPIVHAFPGLDIDSLYFKAIMATHTVAQYEVVRIMYMGKFIGELRGQC